MKKVLAIFLALIIGLSMSAQIQNKFFGLTLGKTTKTTVYNYLKKNNIKFTTTEDGDYRARKMKFAGEVWENVWFSFYNGIFYSVYFQTSEDYKSIELMDVIHRKLDNSLKNKYAIYYDPYESRSDKIVYSDNVTRVGLTYNYFEGVKHLGLMYHDLDLFYKQWESDADEL